MPLTVGLQNCDPLDWLTYFISGSIHDRSHKDGILSGLTWVLDDNHEEISRKITSHAEDWCWNACFLSAEWDETLLSQIRNFDFRDVRNELDDDWRDFVNTLWEKVR